MFSTHTFHRSFSNGLLSGVRILDMSRVMAGPFCTMLLSDLGAEVIKIEKPFVGDETRNWGPPFVGRQISCYFAAINRNKKSVAIDIKNSQGNDLIKTLAKSCDVFIENFVPGKLKQLGLDYESVKQLNPKIVYCSITGFGSSGPYASRSGYDAIAAAVGGLLGITGPEDGEPVRAGVAVTDLSTGLYAKGAILAGLLQKEKNGSGCKIDCNLLSTQVSLLTNLASNYLNCGLKPKRRGTAHENIVPYQAFQCQDSKWLMIGAGSDLMFRKLCDLIGLEHFKNDKRFENNAKRVENRKVLIESITERFKTRPINEWLVEFDNSGIPYGPVNEIDEVFQDKQVLHNQSVSEVDNPSEGKFKVLSSAVNYQSEKNIAKINISAPPLLGQHTEEVLKSVLKLDNLSIKSLEDKNIIQCHKN